MNALLPLEWYLINLGGDVGGESQLSTSGKRKRYPAASDPPGSEGDNLEGLRALDPQVLTVIHQRYYPQIYRYARYRLGDEHTAEDVTGEVFVRLLEAVNRGKGPHSNLRGWLMSTASNLISDHFRKAYARRTESLSDEIQSNDPGPLRVIEQFEQREEVRAAIRRLTPDQQHVLALRFGAGYSLEETARAIGKKVNAVKQLQFRALASLRRHLEGSRR
jgi:RNA polymerase sigma-70 factor (ECF subfamily)